MRTKMNSARPPLNSSLASTSNKSSSGASSSAHAPAADELSLHMAECAQRASRFVAALGFQVEQRNGQRVSIRLTSGAQPEVSAAAASKASGGRTREVFVGKLPRDLFEDELLPAFAAAGRVLKIRLMMDFSGSTRGFGFVEFESHLEALKACKLLDNRPLRALCDPSCVILSYDNRRLFIGNLPIELTPETLLANLREVLQGVQEVELPEGAQPPRGAARHAFVVFESHEAATQARRLLLPAGCKMYNRSVTIDWAKPQSPPPIDEALQQELLQLDQAPLINLEPAGESLVDLNNNINHHLLADRSLLNLPDVAKSNHQDNHHHHHHHHQQQQQQQQQNHHHQKQNRKGHKQSHGQHRHQPKSIFNHFHSAPKMHSPVGVQNTCSAVANLESAPNTSPALAQSILGPKTQFMLDYGFEPLVDFSPSTTTCCSITIHGIKLVGVSINKLRRIFGLDNRLSLANIIPVGPSSVSVSYLRPEHAQTMFEAMIIMPRSFDQLALPGCWLQPVKEFLPPITL